ncbi:hypothetical protein [Cupriavidus sp. IDO]|uniref:hypothetical protein n=1 Tax=Cupriavidus sp. IDO TaxID=1539142 RepID=UPI000B0DC651|nr:hypothetical protein [Cupriavidus sp. IDO]
MKLVLDAGEVDVVASSNLTDEPFEIWEIMGQPVKVETPWKRRTGSDSVATGAPDFQA